METNHKFSAPVFLLVAFGLLRTGFCGGPSTVTMTQVAAETNDTSIKVDVTSDAYSINRFVRVLCNGTTCPSLEQTTSAPWSVTVNDLEASSKLDNFLVEVDGGGDSYTPEPSNGISICTTPEPVTGFAVDSDGTTSEAIKITWDRGAATDTYTLLLNNETIGTVPANSPAEFTYRADNVQGKVDFQADTTYKCKVVATSDLGCPVGPLSVEFEGNCSTEVDDDVTCWSGSCREDECGTAFPDKFTETTNHNGSCSVIRTEIPYYHGNSPKCLEYCFTITQFVFGNCQDIRLYYCCEEDKCLSPLQEPFGNQSCISILDDSADEAHRASVDACINKEDDPPIFISYSTLAAEVGNVTFSVNESVAGFDYVNLFLDGATEPFVCKAEDTFEGNQRHSCVLHGLTVNSIHNITLQGHNPDRDDGTSEAPGLSKLSEVFHIHQGSAFSVTCGSDGYDIEFYFGDLASSKTSVFMSSQTTEQMSEEGTVFNELDAIQSSWYGEMAFVPPTSVFKGYPNAIVVQNDSSYITVLASMYDFIEMPIYNGVPDAYNESMSEVFDLEDKRIVSVSGSFDNGNLTAIKFEAVYDNGSKVESPCYGPAGNCSDFFINQTNSDEFIAGFAGKTNANGYIVELTAMFVTVALKYYHVGIEDCMVETVPDWHDITNFKYHYSVTPPDQCGTIHSMSDSNHTIVYDNTVSRDTGDSNGGGESRNDTFGEGSMKASRHSSGAAANVRCAYHADGVVTSYFNTQGEDDVKAVDLSSVLFQMQFYTDNSFSNTISTHGVLSVISGERLYFGVSFEDMNPLDMSLYAHMCYAKKDNNPEFAADQSDILLLQEDGCPVEDESFMRIDSVRSAADDMMDPLSIQAFYWFDDPNMVVYLHCKVRACPSEDRDNCTAPTSCDSSRRRRREIMFEVPDSPLESFASSQPIIVQKESVVVIQGASVLVGKQTWWLMSVFCGVSAAFLLIILKAFRKQKLNNLFGFQRLKDY